MLYMYSVFVGLHLNPYTFGPMAARYDRLTGQQWLSMMELRYAIESVCKTSYVVALLCSPYMVDVQGHNDSD